MAVTTSSNSYNIPYTNLIQDSFKIEAKVMETSDSMAWECKSFTYGFLGFWPKYNMNMKSKSNKSHIYITKSSNSYKIWYNTPSRLKLKSWKLVIQWHGNARFSHMSFLDVETHRIWKLNYRLIHHIWISQHHPTHRISLIQIWYKTTSRLKPKSMKTSDTMAWDCKLLKQEFLRFKDE